MKNEKYELNANVLASVNGGRKYEDKEVQEDIKLWPFSNASLGWGENWGDKSYFED